MELKPGYKHTELGPLPEDWKVEELMMLADVSSGKRLPKGNELSAIPTGHPYIRVSDMKDGQVDKSEIRHVPEGVVSAIKSYRVYEGDLAISVAGTLGVVSRIDGELDGANLTENANRIAPHGVDSEFLYFQLASPLIQNEIDSIRTVGAQPKLALTRLRQFQIPLPPLQEQEAIAEVLGDVDAQIRANEQLIEKLTNEKEGLSTQLLNGTIRLNGADTTKRKHTELGLLPEDWEVVPLAKILDVCHGKSQKEVEDVNGEFPIYGTGGLMGFANDYLHKGPTVMIGRKGTIDKPRYSEGPVWTVDTLFYCDCSDRLLTRFAFEAFKRIPWRNFNEASGVPSLSSKTIGTIQIPLPPLEEQEAIAEVLGDVDSQIAAAKKLSVKLKAKKSGLMQSLLTGKIRLA